MNSLHPIFRQALAPFTNGLEAVNEAHEATIRERNEALAKFRNFCESLLSDEPYSGTLISDLYAQVDNALALYGHRASSADSGPLWEIFANARLHLCGGQDSMNSKYPHMDKADVQSWYFLADLQDELLAEPEYSILDKVRDEALGD